MIVTLGFRKEDSADSIENLLIDLWQLDIPGLTVSLRTGATIQIETGDGCYAKISNFEDLDRRQIVDLWEFFQKPERKQKFDALFFSGSHAYSKPSVPPPHPASPSTVSLKVERGLARDAIEITRALEKKGGLVSLGVDEETNAILVDSRDGFLEEARVLLRKWQDYYHPVRISDGKTARAEPASVSSSNTEGASASSKAIVLVIDAEAQKSEVVKEVIAALEKAGIAIGQSAETATPTDTPIRVTLNMRKDESYDKIKQLMEALKDAGVQQMSIREGGVRTEGEEERNTLILHLQQGFKLHELQKIESAANSKAAQCGLRLFIVTQNLAQPAGEFFGPTVPQLQTDYKAANQQAHDLAESLRQTPDAAKKAELRTAVQRAFTLRQSLLRAELQEMQARLEKTQQSLDMRDRSADQIVDRRVEDLLNPQLKWDNDGPIGSTPPITSTANAPSTPETAEVDPGFRTSR